jgi:hypothetical protein
MHGIQRIHIKMTNEEIEIAYNEMVEMWGDKLPNPEQEPIRFAYYVRMYKYYKEKNNE